VRTPEARAGFDWGDAFPRGEILLACGLALALRLVYLVGVAQGPLFLHPVIENPSGHPYAWFFAAISGLTGSDPLLLRVVQALLGTCSVFLLSATAHEIWGRRAAVATAQVAALYGPLVYFSSDLSPATFSFFLMTASLYGCARASRASFRPARLISGLALALATAIAIAGGAPVSAADPHRLLHLFSNMALAWNWREVPCGGIDQAFFASFDSAMFRLPWLPSFALVGPMALAAAWRERRRAPLLVGYLILGTVAVAATQVCDRTRLVLLAAAIPLAGQGIDRLFAAVSEAAGKTVRAWPGAPLLSAALENGATLVAFGCAAVLVLVPSPQYPRPQAGAGWVVVAHAYQDAGNPRAAQGAYVAAERSGMRSADFYADWGRLEFEKRLGILAEQHLLTAIGLDPANAAAHETLGQVYDDQERPGQAGQEYAVAAGLLPKRSAELYTRAGEAYAADKNPGRAAEMFRIALRVEPGYPAALAGLYRIQHPVAPPPPVKMFPPLGGRAAPSRAR
jgi:tetratricopeptide (TPR) repeat protein